MPATGLSVSQFGDSTMSLGFALAEQGHIVQSHYPAVVLDTTVVNGDVVSLKNYVRVEFIVVLGDGDPTADDGKITVEACDDFVPTAVVAIPFRLYKNEAGSGDVLDAGTNIPATGYLIKKTDNITYVVEVLDEHLPAGKPNVRLVLLTCTGGTSVPLAVMALLSGSRSAAAQSLTAIA